MHAPRRSRTPRWLLGLVLIAPSVLVALSSAEPERPLSGNAAASLELAASSSASAALVAFEPPAQRRLVSEGVLGRGETVSGLLRAEGVEPVLVTRIARELAGHVDFRFARPGESFELVRDAEGALLRFRYRRSGTESVLLERDGTGFRVTREQERLEPRAARIAGVITRSLYHAVTALGEDGQLARDFAEIFAWDIDFHRSVQPGDAFHVLYERLYRRAGGERVYVRPGRILAARYEGAAGSHTAVYFESREGRGGYYRPDGTSVEGAFLMAPLRHARITSRFSSARRHPILNVTRPHHGIDYAARTGTPVWSVADGVVVHRGRAGGFGNLVKVKHSGGYTSYYAHLSRFAKGLRVGDRVAQKQVVGFVGQTGLATGPHVCFRVQKDGRYVNPAVLRRPSGDPVPPAALPSFHAARDLLLAELAERRQIAARR